MWGATISLAANGMECLGISIHAPRVGRDLDVAHSLGIAKAFQSTRPVWGATRFRRGHRQLPEISIHAPRVGRDEETQKLVERGALFQSTRPVWGATIDENK